MKKHLLSDAFHSRWCGSRKRRKQLLDACAAQREVRGHAEALKGQISLLEKESETLFQQQRALAELLGTMRDVTPTFAAKAEEMLKQIGDGVAQIHTDLNSITKSFGAQVQSSHAEMKNLLTNVIRTAHDDIKSSLTENAKVIKEGVITLDKALQTELNSSLEALGRQLASLSQKFVQDYEPLTDRLREVVQLARRAQ